MHHYQWHAGHATVFQAPTGRGFKTSLGYFNGACDHYTQRDGEDGCGEVTDLWDSDRPGHGMNGTYGDYLYAGRAVSVIESHDTTAPLFLYLALQVCFGTVPARPIALSDPLQPRPLAQLPP